MDIDYGIAPPGYRLPAETRLGCVRLQVAALDRSIAYYREVIGMRLLDRSGGVARLGPEGEEVVLVELHERPGAAPVPRRGRLGLYHFAILLPDRGALGRFIRHLAEIGAGAGASDHRVSEALYLQDPDGLGIEVYVDRPRHTWQASDGELVMRTDPLDTAAVVRTAGEGRWEGLPPGTVIGHVHLHVGDLGAAEGFYHAGLGLDKVVWSYPGALFLSAGGYHHHLGTNTWAAGALPAADTDARLLEWEVVLPGEEQVVTAGRAVEAAGHPVRWSAPGWTVQDPWGTVVRVRAG